MARRPSAPLPQSSPQPPAAATPSLATPAAPTRAEPLRPSVLYAARSACSPSWEWKNPAGHQDKLNLWLIVDGIGSWQGGGRTYPLAAGDCFVQRLWQPCHGTTDPERPLVVLWANCTLRRADGTVVALAQLPEARLPPLHRRFASGHFIASLAQRMIDRFESEGMGPATDQWLACIWDELGVAAQPSRADGRLAELISEIRAHPERPWRVAGLARALAMPVDRFTRRFHAHTGVPPRTFLVRARLESAKALLRMSNDRIAAIASRLGFCDIYHFSRRFRQHVGCSPSAYRSGVG